MLEPLLFPVSPFLVCLLKKKKRGKRTSAKIRMWFLPISCASSTDKSSGWESYASYTITIPRKQFQSRSFLQGGGAEAIWTPPSCSNKRHWEGAHLKQLTLHGPVHCHLQRPCRYLHLSQAVHSIVWPSAEMHKENYMNQQPLRLASPTSLPCSPKQGHFQSRSLDELVPSMSAPVSSSARRGMGVWNSGRVADSRRRQHLTGS